MKLSVVISSYNQKEFLIEAIESCLNQEFNDSFEIVIGDDGSTDGSIEVIKSYVKKYPNKFKYFVADRNDGVDIVGFRSSNIRQRGASLCSGEYLIIMDGDDIFLNRHSFQKQADFLDRNPQYAACYTDFELFSADGKKEVRTVNYDAMNNSVFWANLYVHLTCFMFRRQVLAYFIPLFVNDCMALFSILKTGKIYHISDLSFGYRQLNNSMYHSFNYVEKCVREILVVQVIKNTGGYNFSTCARYKDHVFTVFENRNELSQEKYQKYFRHSNKYKNDYLQKFKDYDNANIFGKLGINLFLTKCRMAHLFFRMIKVLTERFNGKNLMTYTSVDP